MAQIKDDVEIIESNRDDAKKGVCTVIIKWGYKDDTKEKAILAISQLGGAEEKHWVVSSLTQRT